MTGIWLVEIEQDEVKTILRKMMRCIFTDIGSMQIIGLRKVMGDVLDTIGSIQRQKLPLDGTNEKIALTNISRKRKNRHAAWLTTSPPSLFHQLTVFEEKLADHFIGQWWEETIQEYGLLTGKG